MPPLHKPRADRAERAYCLENLDAAARFFEAVRSTHGQPMLLFSLAVARRRAAVEFGRLLLQLPRRTLALTADPNGRDIREHLSEDITGRFCTQDVVRNPSGHFRSYAARRLAVGVLEIPPCADDFLLGSKRQRIRTSLRQADRVGLVCRELVSSAEQLAAVQQVLDDRADSWLHSEGRACSERIRDGRGRTFAAFGPGGETVAIAVVVADVEWAYLRISVSVSGDRSSAARYLVQVRTVQALSRSGVRYLIGGSMLYATPGIRQFQHIFGYRAQNLRLGPTVIARRQPDPSAAARRSPLARHPMRGLR